MSEREGHKLVWQKFITGDQHALSELYQQHYLGLINYGSMIIEDKDFVNDCFMEMLIEFWEKRLSLPKVENVRSYLMTSLRRSIFHALDSDKRRLVKEDESLQSTPDHEWSYEDHLIKLESDSDLKAKIANALYKLTDRQKEIVRMKFFDDLDYDTIAEKCRITKRTAYNIIHDAIKVLKTAL